MSVADILKKCKREAIGIGKSKRRCWNALWLLCTRCQRRAFCPLIYKTMEETDQEALTWSQLVSIWQVIGRLVRGGCPAHVVFCDASFARVTLDTEGKKHLYAGLLFGMREVLAPFFDLTRSSTMNAREQALVKILYEPLYRALESLSIQL